MLYPDSGGFITIPNVVFTGSSFCLRGDTECLKQQNYSRDLSTDTLTLHPASLFEICAMRFLISFKSDSSMYRTKYPFSSGSLVPVAGCFSPNFVCKNNLRLNEPGVKGTFYLSRTEGNAQIEFFIHISDMFNIETVKALRVYLTGRLPPRVIDTIANFRHRLAFYLVEKYITHTLSCHNLSPFCDFNSPLYVSLLEKIVSRLRSEPFLTTYPPPYHTLFGVLLYNSTTKFWEFQKLRFSTMRSSRVYE